MPFNEISETDRILIALTSLALNAPSTYTIAWSKGEPEKEKHFPILYAGIGTSAATVLGAILGKKWYGDKLMWAGMLATLALFGYVVFFYKPNSSVGESTMIGGPPTAKPQEPPIPRQEVKFPIENQDFLMV